MVFAGAGDDSSFYESPSSSSPLIIILAAWQNPEGFRRNRTEAEADQAAIFHQARPSDRPEKGRVLVEFHTYYGFLVYVTCTKYRFWEAPEEARTTPWRLHCFNCTRGLFAYGAFLIPLVSWMNYAIQKKSVKRQESALKGGKGDLDEIEGLL